MTNINTQETVYSVYTSQGLNESMSIINRLNIVTLQHCQQLRIFGSFQPHSHTRDRLFGLCDVETE
jgi:hypothetical protein